MAETSFPGAWQLLSPEVRRFLIERCRDRLLEQHDGPAGLIQWLYAGTERPNGTRALFAGSIEYYWAMVEEDVARWKEARQRAAGQQTSTGE